MNQFKKIINYYIDNYFTLKKGKIEFDCDYGELIFYNNLNNKYLILNGIYIFPQYRNKGLCREILYYLIDECTNKFKYLCIQSVISKILHDYLSRFMYKNKSFKHTKYGFIYKIIYS
jgi:hypothetical protein